MQDLLHKAMSNANPICRENLSPQEIGDFVVGCRYGIIDNTIRDWCYGHNVVDDVKARWERTFGH